MDLSVKAKNYLRKLDRLDYTQIDVFDTYDALGIYDDADENKYVESVNRFLDHEHLFKKSACFWKVAAIMFRLYASDTRWDDAFNRYGRHKLPFTDRLKGSTLLYPKDYGGEKQLQDGWIQENQSPEYQKYFRSLNDNDDITICRSFKVRQGEVVRKGVKKLDNPDAHIQVEGRGRSYTLSYQGAASWLNQSLNPYFLRKYGDLNTEEEQR
jgi:hypothetical protein